MEEGVTHPGTSFLAGLGVSVYKGLITALFPVRVRLPGSFPESREWDLYQQASRFSPLPSVEGKGVRFLPQGAPTLPTSPTILSRL